MVIAFFFCISLISALNASDALDFQVGNSLGETDLEFEEFKDRYLRLINEEQEELKNAPLVTQVTFEGPTFEVIFQNIKGIKTLSGLQNSLQEILNFAIQQRYREELILIQDAYQAANQFVLTDIIFSTATSMARNIKGDVFYQAGKFANTLLPATRIGYCLARLAFEVGNMKEMYSSELIETLYSDPQNPTDIIKGMFNEFDNKVANLEQNGQTETLEYMVCKSLKDFYKEILTDIDLYQNVPTIYGIFNVFPAVKLAHFLYSFIITKNDIQVLNSMFEKWAAKRGIGLYDINIDEMFSCDKSIFFNF
jgi:hypothetical protein